MDIWETLYEHARKEYHPEEVTPFIYAHHVVCALESEDGEIYTGFCIESCCGIMNLCAERVAALNMYVNSGQTKIKRLIAFREQAPNGGESGMPCGACREFLYQLNEENENMEIMVDYATREVITLKELMPNWWGKERYKNQKSTVETERLMLYPISNEEMCTLIEQEKDPEMKRAYMDMLEGCLHSPQKRIWNAVWNMELKDTPGVIVGDFCFKGLGKDGMVEIGYGLKEEYQHRGYMTEALKAITRWALSQDGVTKVEAETDPENTASQNVLLNTGFKATGEMGEEGPRFVFQGSDM